MNDKVPRPHVWYIVALFIGAGVALWLIITGGPSWK